MLTIEQDGQFYSIDLGSEDGAAEVSAVLQRKADGWYLTESGCTMNLGRRKTRAKALHDALELLEAILLAKRAAAGATS